MTTISDVCQRYKLLLLFKTGMLGYITKTISYRVNRWYIPSFYYLKRTFCHGPFLWFPFLPQSDFHYMEKHSSTCSYNSKQRIMSNIK